MSVIDIIKRVAGMTVGCIGVIILGIAGLLCFVVTAERHGSVTGRNDG